MTSRRDFLRSSASLAATAAAARSFPALAEAAQSSRKVRAWTTAGTAMYQPADAPQWADWHEKSALSIELDPSVRKQEILGFGGAFTDASCYLFGQMPETARHDLLTSLYGKNGLNLSVGRTCIGSSDYSRTAYSFDDSATPDPELQKFSIEHDKAYILPTLREAAKINPELYLFSSPWSPPGWMKDHNTLLGGTMVDTYYQPYAEYFVRFVEDYAKNGVNIRAVTVQNETDTNQSGRMPQCQWGQQYEMEFVSRALGPAFAHASLDTKIWILDHNYVLWGRVLDELSDASVYQYVDGIAWHGYVGTPDAMTRVHNEFPEKHAYWTEGGPDVFAPDYATDWANWATTFTGILRNWARCITSWNLVLDEQGKPDIGPFKCGGVVTVDSKGGALRYSGQYRAFAHFSKTVTRGARVLGTTGDLPEIAHVAFENPDGSRVLVVTNKGAQQVAQVVLGREALQLTVPADSVTTLAW